MSDSGRHCPRCGTYLPTVTVRVPVWRSEDVMVGAGVITTQVFDHYEDRDDIGECIRCTGSY